MSVRGIKIAPEGSKCEGCWDRLSDEDRKGASYATIEVFSIAMGQSYSFVLYYCRECAKRAVMAAQSKIGICILKDGAEGAVRSLVRLSDQLAEKR